MTAELHVRWVLPPFFHEIPVQGEVEDIVERLHETTCEVLAAENDQVRLTWAVLNASFIGPMRDAGVQYAGMCFLDMDSRTSIATILVALSPLRDMLYAQAVDETVRVLQRARPDAEVTTLTLPAGPAAVVIGSHTAGASPDGPGLTTGVIQVYLPLPNEREMLILELSTPCLEDWDFYSEMFADVVRSIEAGELTAVEAAGESAAAEPEAGLQRPSARPMPLSEAAAAALDPFGTRLTVPSLESEAR